MKHLFLTSSVHVVAQDIAKKVDISKNSKNNELVFINTAAESVTGDKTWLENDRQALINAGFEVTDYTITGKTLTQLKKDLNGYRYIYLSGGNTYCLIQQSQKTGFTSLIKDLILKQGKIYIGTSAGSIIAGPKCPDYLLSAKQIRRSKQVKGYGLVNFTVVPHWGSKEFKDLYLKKRLKIAYKIDQVPLLLLTDNQYVHVVDGCYEIIDMAK